MAKKKTGKTGKKKAVAKKKARSVASPARKKVAKKTAKPKAAGRTTSKKKSAAKSAKTSSRKTAAKAVKTARKPIRAAKSARRAATASRVGMRPPSDNHTGNANVKVKPLTARELSGFRDLLLEKRAHLVGDVSRMENEALSKNRQDASGDLSNMPIHMADIGTDNYEQEFTLGLIEGERALLREIDEALARIDKGTYGVCEATGKPISKARLKAQPWTKHCYEYVLAKETGSAGRF